MLDYDLELGDELQLPPGPDSAHVLHTGERKPALEPGMVTKSSLLQYQPDYKLIDL